MKKHYVLLCFSEFEVGIVAIPFVLCVFLDFGPFWARSQIQKAVVLLSKCYVLGPPRVPQRGVQGRLREAVLDSKKLQKHCFCCVFSVGDPKKLIKPVVFNQLCLGTLPGGTFH